MVEADPLEPTAIRNPLVLSGLILAGANAPPALDQGGLPLGDDGRLTAEEVISTDLRNAEVVTLSACETGLGRSLHGEGVFGLQRAFQLAGAQTVVASLWKVEDRATQILMVAFYRNLWVEKLGRLESLHRAQLQLIRDYAFIPGRGLTLRGVDGTRSSTPLNRKGADSKRLAPFFWAAFTLSGDWR